MLTIRYFIICYDKYDIVNCFDAYGTFCDLPSIFRKSKAAGVSNVDENDRFSNICCRPGEGHNLIELLFVYIICIQFFFKRCIDLYINHVYFVQGEQDRMEKTSETKTS